MNGRCLAQISGISDDSLVSRRSWYFRTLDAIALSHSVARALLHAHLTHRSGTYLFDSTDGED